MKQATLVIFLLAFATFFLTAFTFSCRGFVGNAVNEFQDVDWWIVLKAPESKEKGSEHFLYISPANLDGIYFDSEKKGVQALFGEQHKAAIQQNEAAYQYFYDQMVPKINTGPGQSIPRPSQLLKTTRDLIKEEILEIKNMINVWQVWFNDQPGSSFLEHSAPGAAHSDTTESVKKQLHLKYGHSKYLLSVSTDGTSGSLIQHSFPSTPRYLYQNPVQVKSTIELLTTAFPQFVDFNFQPHLVSDNTIMNLVRDIIKSTTIASASSTCQNAWGKVLSNSQAAPNPSVNTNNNNKAKKDVNLLDDARGIIYRTMKGVLTEQLTAKYWLTDTRQYGQTVNTFTDCTKFATFNDGDIRLISHVPVNHGEIRSSVEEDDGPLGAPEEGRKKVKQADENLDGKNLKNSPITKVEKFYRPVSSIGPVHWLSTSQLTAPLYVAFWVRRTSSFCKRLIEMQKNDPLPTIVAPNAAVITVDKIDGINGFSWVHGQGHEKIGIATKDAATDVQNPRPYVCFGDSNHRGSEISHAGMMICLKNNGVWKTMHALISSVITNKYQFSISYGTSPPVASEFNDSDKRYGTLIAIPKPLKERNALREVVNAGSPYIPQVKTGRGAKTGRSAKK